MTLLFAANMILLFYQGITREVFEPVAMCASLDYADRFRNDLRLVRSKLCKCSLPFGIAPVLYVSRVGCLEPQMVFDLEQVCSKHDRTKDGCPARHHPYSFTCSMQTISSMRSCAPMLENIPAYAVPPCFRSSVQLSEWPHVEILTQSLLATVSAGLSLHVSSSC
jgi:hypothetical protein